METVFNEIQHSVKNWWASLLLGIVYIIVALWLMFAPLSSYVALSIVFSISMLISGCSQQSKRCAKLGLVYRGRNHRRYSRHLPDCLSHGQHGSHSVYHSLLAHVPRLLLHRLLDRPETLWYSRLGLVHGFRYPCHYMFLIDIVATGHRCTLRGLYDFFHFPHYRTIPCHAFL